ncbi:MAG: hypothetical protein ACRDV6_01315 [Acidimicrobiales bacterium]
MNDDRGTPSVESGLAELELELRMLPGVLNVGFGTPEPTGHVTVCVVAVHPDPGLEVEATRIARSFGGPASVEVTDLSPPVRGAPPQATVLNSDERVALVTSTLDEVGHARVVLSWMGSSATGTATAGALIGPAMATLQALDQLGVGIEASLASVSSGQGIDNPPVRVILRSTQSDAEFVGVARAATASESAARATLAAFNRFVGGRSVELN